MRQFYVQRAHRPELIESTLTRAISSFLTSLNTLVELTTGQAAQNKSLVIESAERIGLDGETLRKVFALKRSELQPDTDELKQLYDGFMMTVQNASALLEKLLEA